MGLLSALADAIFHEYDRRIKRASNITEYGQHHGHAADHADTAHAAEEHAPEDEAEITNIPRGTAVVSHAPVTNKPPIMPDQP